MEQQEDNRINLAIVSPNKEAFSESFIAAHRDLLPFNIYYYYGGNIPNYIGHVNLGTGSFYNRVRHSVMKKLTTKDENFLSHNLKKSFRNNRIQVVLAEYGTVGSAMLGICKSLGLPLVTHFHGFDASVYDVLEKNKVSYGKLFEYAATTIVSVSRAMNNKILALGCPADKIVCNPYGPHDDFFRVQPNPNSNIFVSLGRFVDKKAPYYTIFAFEKALQEFPEMELVMGGDGPLLNSCKNITRYLGIESKVHFPGILDRESFIKILSGSFCYVQHSITAENGDMEGTPVSILEASAAGLPIISTQHAGIPDIVIDNETGLLVHEHDIRGMANNMIYMLNNRNKALEMGSKGKAYIKTNFPMSKHIDTLKKIIEASSLNKINNAA